MKCDVCDKGGIKDEKGLNVHKTKIHGKKKNILDKNTIKTFIYLLISLNPGIRNKEISEVLGKKGTYISPQTKLLRDQRFIYKKKNRLGLYANYIPIMEYYLESRTKKTYLNENDFKDIKYNHIFPIQLIVNKFGDIILKKIRLKLGFENKKAKMENLNSYIDRIFNELDDMFDIVVKNSPISSSYILVNGAPLDAISFYYKFFKLRNRKNIERDVINKLECLQSLKQKNNKVVTKEIFNSLCIQLKPKSYERILVLMSLFPFHYPSTDISNINDKKSDEKVKKQIKKILKDFNDQKLIEEIKINRMLKIIHDDEDFISNIENLIKSAKKANKVLKNIKKKDYLEAYNYLEEFESYSLTN